MRSFCCCLVHRKRKGRVSAPHAMSLLAFDRHTCVQRVCARSACSERRDDEKTARHAHIVPAQKSKTRCALARTAAASSKTPPSKRTDGTLAQRNTIGSLKVATLQAKTRSMEKCALFCVLRVVFTPLRTRCYSFCSFFRSSRFVRKRRIPQMRLKGAFFLAKGGTRLSRISPQLLLFEV